MASKRAKQPTIVRNVKAALKGVRDVVSTAQKAKTKKANARELLRIEQLLGEDFDSLAQAKRALARETKTVKAKPAAKAKPATPQAKPAKPRKAAKRASAKAPAPPAPPAPSVTIADLERLPLVEALALIETNAAELERQLPPGSLIEVQNFFGKRTRNVFSSFAAAAQFARKYARKRAGAEKLDGLPQRIRIVPMFGAEQKPALPPSERAKELAASTERSKALGKKLTALEKQEAYYKRVEAEAEKKESREALAERAERAERIAEATLKEIAELRAQLAAALGAKPKKKRSKKK
jgi:hypothetical protein